MLDLKGKTLRLFSYQRKVVEFLDGKNLENICSLLLCIPLHTVTKAKRNVQKLHLPGIELTIFSRRPKVGTLDHSATKLVYRFGSTSDS